jgi:hypothetical protein
MLPAIDTRNAEGFFASPNVSISDVSGFMIHFISKSKPYSRFASAKNVTTSVVFDEPRG